MHDGRNRKEEICFSESFKNKFLKLLVHTWRWDRYKRGNQNLTFFLSTFSMLSYLKVSSSRHGWIMTKPRPLGTVPLPFSLSLSLSQTGTHHHIMCSDFFVYFCLFYLFACVSFVIWVCMSLCIFSLTSIAPPNHTKNTAQTNGIEKKKNYCKQWIKYL